MIEEQHIDCHQRRRHPGGEDPLRADLRDAQRRLRAPATGAISPAARRSTWARPSASSRRSRSASRARSSPCAPSTSAARRRSPTVLHRVELRGHGQDAQPQRGPQLGRRPHRDGPQHRGRRRRRRTGPSARCTASSTAPASRSTRATRSSAASASPSGTPIPVPILTEVDGTVGYEDLVDGMTITETTDESTGITKRVVIDWRASPHVGSASGDRDQGTDGKIEARARRRRPLRSCRSTRSSRSIRAPVSSGDVLARVSTESAKTRDITGGLPRVAELFEARRPKDAAIIAEKSGVDRFGRTTRTSAGSRSPLTTAPTRSST
jgi:hypothetical protein